MASSSAEPTVNFARTLAAAALPWLLSTTAHSLLLIALALAVRWTQRDTTRGVRADTGLRAVFIESPGSDDAEGSGSGDIDTEPPDDQATGAYYDDEPAASAQNTATPGDDTLAGGGNTLGALLNERPAVGLSGVLRAGGVDWGPGGAGGGGVGSAQGLTTHPGGPRRMRGGYARTGVFGAIGEGHKFVYVFDRSGSMDGHGGAPLSAAKAELVNSLKQLGSTHQFQIIFYNEHPRVFNPTGTPGRLVFGTDQNKYLAQKFVGSITADGATQHVEALEMALRMGPDVIFFLTDADEPRMTAKQLARLAQLNKGSSINAIEFGFGPQSDPDNFLVTLARQNGGKHVYVDVSRLPAPRR
jgi:hypothetical protein